LNCGKNYKLMKIVLNIIASVLLLFNGIGAIYGGLNLITHPDGSSIQLSSEWLKHTPFHNYLIPGIVLLIANGLLSILVFIALLFNHRKYPWLVTAQGVILAGWILIQMMMIQTVYFLHIILGSVGVLLIITGYLLIKLNSKNIVHGAVI